MRRQKNFSLFFLKVVNMAIHALYRRCEKKYFIFLFLKTKKISFLLLELSTVWRKIFFVENGPIPTFAAHIRRIFIPFFGLLIKPDSIKLLLSYTFEMRLSFFQIRVCQFLSVSRGIFILLNFLITVFLCLHANQLSRKT